MKTKLLALLFLMTGSLKIYSQWTIQASGFSTAGLGINDISIVNSSVVWASAFDTTGTTTVNKFTRTLNGGATWTVGSITGASALDISSICAYNKDTAWVSMLDNNVGGGKIYRTNNGGTTWTAQTTASFSAPGGSTDFIYMFNKNNGVCVGDSNSGYWEIYTTNNGGTNWVRVTSGNIPTNLVGEIGYENNYCAVGNNIWFGTSAGRIYRSTNSGTTWSVSTTSLSVITRVAFKDANNGIATDGSSLVKTTNGGVTWTALAHTGTLYDTDLIYVSGTTGTYMSTGATFYGGASNGSSYSVDDGATWVNIDAVGHSALAFLNTTTGWSGGVNISPTSNGSFKWNGSFITGIKTFAFSKNEFNAYPNPSKDFLILELNTSKQAPEAYKLELYDIIGRNVYEQNLFEAKTIIDVSYLPQGIFIYKIVDSKNIVTTGKLVHE